MIIRQMRQTDLDFAATLTKKEGWESETRLELEGFLGYDPEGCFIAESQGDRAGMCIGTSYGNFGFVGELIVKEEKRGRGVGRQLLEHTIQYLRARGALEILLDAVPTAATLYERVGFRRICRSMRFLGSIEGLLSKNVKEMHSTELETISKTDARIFGADRKYFLRRRHLLYPELCKVYSSEGVIHGFIMGSRGRNIISIGPWIVDSQVKPPGALLGHLAETFKGSTLRLGVLETNTSALEVIRGFGFEENPNPPWRMALGEHVEYGNPRRMFAIGSPAKG